MTGIQKFGIVRKIASLSSLLIFAILLIAFAANYWRASVKAVSDHQKKLETQLDLLSQSLEAPLWELDTNTVNLIGDAFMAGTDVISLTVHSRHNGEIIYSRQIRDESGSIFGERDIYHNEELIGHIRIGVSGSAYDTTLHKLLIYSMLFLLVLTFLFTAAIKLLLNRYLEAPLEKFGLWTDRVAGGDYQETPPEIELEEFKKLVGRFSQMSRKIRQREFSLTESEQKFRGLFENSEVSIWNEDISEVVQSLESLRREGVVDLRRYLENNRDLAWKLAAKVKINDVNDATLKLFGAENKQQMLGRIFETFGPKADEIFVEVLCAIWENRKEFRSEVAFCSLDGRHIDAIITLNIPDSMDSFYTVPVCITDISDLKKAEAELNRYRQHLEQLVEEKTRELKLAQDELVQRERLATLGKLSATISHEILNPLGTIQNALFPLSSSLEKCADARANMAVDIIERNINRCVKIIEDINGFARVRKLDLTAVDLSEWLPETVNELGLPDNIECSFELENDLPVHIDTDKLRQVVINLVNNAVHALQAAATDKKQLRLTTRSFGNRFEINVADNGIGMSAQTRENMFEPLFSTKGFGVGLGMAVVKNIIELHHGIISVDSNEGAGTTITLSLPINWPEI